MVFKSAKTPEVGSSKEADGCVRDAESFDLILDLYRSHARTLVQLSAVIIGDRGSAEDAVQDAFIEFRAQLVKRNIIANPLAYLRRMVINRSHRIARKSRHWEGLVNDDSFLATNTVESEALDHIRGQQIRLVIASLPGRQREVIVLEFLAGLSTVEIADALRISPGAVRSASRKAMVALSTRLRQGEGIDE